MGRERRRRNRRPGPRPAVMTGQPIDAATEASATDRPRSATERRPEHHPEHHQVRSDRVLHRETIVMLNEMKRVVLVSGICFGMLAVLVVVDRLQ